MSGFQIGIYARVSSERQASEHTIASQVAALEDRVTADGLPLLPELRFLDDGYSGSSLRRPGLERLRDAAAAGQLDRLYVHAPDRLARSYAHQILLVDELRSCGVELVFLNHPLGHSPKTSCCCRCRASSRNTSVPRRWSAAAAGSGMQHNKEQWVC